MSIKNRSKPPVRRAAATLMNAVMTVFFCTGSGLASLSPGYVELIAPGGPNDSALIQHTLDQLPEGATLKLTGNFVIGNTIYLPSNIRWVLDGSLSLGEGAQTNLDRVGWVAPGIDARRSTAITEKPGGAGRIEMSGGTYNGNAGNNKGSLRLINFVSVTNSYFHDMVITNVSDDNFTLGPGCRGNVCSNLISSYSIRGNALTDKGDHNKWFDCIAEDCLGTDGDGWTPKCRYSEFYRCIARRNGGPGFGMYCRVDGSDDQGEAIDGNKFYACESYENWGGAGFSFNISANSGPGASIRSNYIEAVCYSNLESGVRFRNDMPDGVVADNEINLFCWGNRGLSGDGISVSKMAGGLGTDGLPCPVYGITGSIVSFDNGYSDVNLRNASNCVVTVYRPLGKDPKLIKGTNQITVKKITKPRSSDPWCVRAYFAATNLSVAGSVSLASEHPAE